MIYVVLGGAAIALVGLILRGIYRFFNGSYSLDRVGKVLLLTGLCIAAVAGIVLSF